MLRCFGFTNELLYFLIRYHYHLQGCLKDLGPSFPLKLKGTGHLDPLVSFGNLSVIYMKYVPEYKYIIIMVQ